MSEEKAKKKEELHFNFISCVTITQSGIRTFFIPDCLNEKDYDSVSSMKKKWEHLGTTFAWDEKIDLYYLEDEYYCKYEDGSVLPLREIHAERIKNR